MPAYKAIAIVRMSLILSFDPIVAMKYAASSYTSEEVWNIAE